VHESIYEEFVRKSVERAKQRTTGDPIESKSEAGPVVSIFIWPDTPTITEEENDLH
jgi:hypothetical protein